MGPKSSVSMRDVAVLAQGVCRHGLQRVEFPRPCVRGHPATRRAGHREAGLGAQRVGPPVAGRTQPLDRHGGHGHRQPLLHRRGQGRRGPALLRAVLGAGGQQRLQPRPGTDPPGAVRAAAGRWRAVRPDRGQRRVGAPAAAARHPRRDRRPGGQRHRLLLRGRGRRRRRTPRRASTCSTRATGGSPSSADRVRSPRCGTVVTVPNWPSSRPAGTRPCSSSARRPQASRPG